jgi:hypothetical protein
MLLGFPLAAAQMVEGQNLPVLAAVTYANQPSEIYLPLRESAKALNWSVEWDDASSAVILREKALSPGSLQRLPGKKSFVRLTALAALGAEAGSPDGGKTLEVWSGEWKAKVEIPTQRVEICLTEQKMVAFQGPHLVMTTNISSGRRGFGTPAGSYRAQYKQRHRVSRKYANAPMPYSVNLFGGYFIHGASSVPRTPASHGCIRMPLTRGNPASQFFNWVEVGTPIRITRGWSESVKALLEPIAAPQEAL